MGVPVAVSPATKTPGLYLRVDLLSGASSPGTAKLRALIIAPKSGAGAIKPDAEVREGLGGADDAKAIWGPGTQGHLAAVRLFGRYGVALVHGVAPAASAGAAAAGSFTLSGQPTSEMTVRITIKGVRMDVPWHVGELPNQGRDRCVAAVNAATDAVPSTAAPTAVAGQVKLVAKVPGLWGNDIKLSVELLGTGGAVAVAAFGGGTIEPNFATVLSLIAQREYDIIVACVSNADAEDSSGSSNISKLKAQLGARASGLNAKLQTCVVGVTSALPTGPKAGASKINEGPIEYVYCMNGQELGCEWAGFEAGDRLKRQELELGNPNRIGTVFDGFLGAADKVLDQPTDPEVEDALNCGLSIINYTAQGDPFLTAPITTHSQDPGGNPDFRIYYVTEVTGAYEFAKDLRTALPQEFYQVKIVKDQPPGSEPLPDKTVEERDVKAFAISRARFFQAKGVLRRDRLDEAIANGTLIVQVDASDPSQVDIGFPIKIVAPLAKFSVVVQKLAG